MKVPVHEKYMLTTAEAADYFSIGTKQIRKILLEHPEIAIWYGNKWVMIREEAEQFFATLPADQDGRRELF